MAPRESFQPMLSSNSTEWAPAQPRHSKTGIVLAWAAGLVILMGTAVGTSAQQHLSVLVGKSELPDAPDPQSAARVSPATADLATIVGTVLDPNSNAIQGARVQITGHAGATIGVVESGGDGLFKFAGLAPGSYKIKVTGPGMGQFVSPE